MTLTMNAQHVRFLARIGGLLYLLIIVLGGLGELAVRGRIVVPRDPLATAANLRSMEWLWRLGIAGEVVLLLAAVAVTLILYLLLRPVHRELALLAVMFNLVSMAIEGMSAVSLAAALAPLTNAGYASAFSPQQLGVLAMLAVRSHSVGFAIALIFFAAVCVIYGYLIRRSAYIPATIGILMQIAGVCYAVNSFALLLSPPLAGRLFPAILIPSLIAELSLTVWLLAKGVRAEVWDLRSRA